MHLRRQRPTALRQAVLRAVSEDNRALVAAPDSPSFGTRRSRPRLVRAPRSLPFRRLFTVALLVVGSFFLNPAVTGLSAYRGEMPRDLQQADDGLRDVSMPAETADQAPDQVSSLWAEASAYLDETSLLKSVEAILGAPGYVPEFALSAAADGMPITALFGLNVRTIVVDAGHGGADPGAVGAHGTKEKDVTLDVARRLASSLERDGRYQVVLTRSGDETVSLARRVERANAADADLFVSIHVNALPNRHVNVIETYHFDFSEDPAALQLAAIENRDSGMPVGYFRTLLEKIGDTVKLQESRALAQYIQTSMINNVRRHDAKVFDSGVKVAPFVVLIGVSVPAVLVEISCISNRDEEFKLRTPQYRERIALFLEEGIATYLDHRQLQARGPAHHEREDASETANHRYRQGS